MAFLTTQERQTLALICDTLLPSLEAQPGEDAAFFRLGAADLNLANWVETALELVADQTNRSQLRLFLRAIEMPVLGGVVSGKPRSFSRLLPTEREDVLRRWAASDIPTLRKTFQSLKRLSAFLFYSLMPDGASNPAWRTFHYTLPPSERTRQERWIQPLSISAPTTLTADVLVIGSGAGGGVVAAELAAAGFDVLIAEKGGYRADSEFNGRELDSHEQLFEKRGSLATEDLAILILAGSTLGGGTTINWAGAFRPPAPLLEEWARDYGFTGATSPEFACGVDAVTQRIHVNDVFSQPNPQNCALEEGCAALGYTTNVIQRNVKDCVECGFCNFGCAHGAKQSTLKTYLMDAYERGARIVVNAHVHRLLIERGRATGALMTVQGANGNAGEVIVNAKAVVVAAGAIHTPALLRRSGLTNPHIGANLHLHPTTSIYGLFDHPIRGWQGPIMTRVSGEFANLDGRGYGVRLETAPVHPGLAALALSWDGGRAHRKTMSQLEHLANIIILTRDRDGGQIALDKAGNPIVRYRLSQRDATHMMRGTAEALRVFHAARAYEISSPHTPPMIYRRDRHDWPSVDGYLAAVERRGYRRNGFALFSAHQMSSCRIGGSAAVGAIKPTGETYEVGNLFVADASVLPTASGVNPMVTIMATAHYLAQHVKATLGA